MQDRIEMLRELNGELCAEVNALTRVHVDDVERIDALESLVEFMEPFFMFSLSHQCGCPNDYAEPHDCDKGCKALGEFRQRIAALGMEVDG